MFQALPWLGGDGLARMLGRALEGGREAVERVQEGRWELVDPADVPPKVTERLAFVQESGRLLDQKKWKQAAHAATRAIDAVGWDGQAFAQRASARLSAGDAAGALADADTLLAVAAVEEAVWVRGLARERLGRGLGATILAMRGAEAARQQRDAEAAVLFKQALLARDHEGLHALADYDE